jgi:hypothetical protein
MYRQLQYRPISRGAFSQIGITTMTHHPITGHDFCVKITLEAAFSHVGVHDL